MSKREFHVTDAVEYNQSSPLRWIVAHALRYKFFLTTFALALALANGLNAAVARLTGSAFDAVLAPEPSAAALTTIALTILGLVVVRGVADMSGHFSMEVVAKRMERDARDELYLNLLGKSQTFHNQQRVGDLMARANNDVRQINDMMMPGVALIFDAGMGVLMPLIFIGLLRLELLLSPLLFLVAFYLALRDYMRRLGPVSEALRGEFGQMNATLTQTITGIEVVKSTAQEAQEMGKFLGRAGAFRDFYIRNGQIQAWYLPALLLGVAIAGAFLHGILLLLDGRLAVGELVAYMGLMSLLRFPTFISIFTFSLVQLGIASAERILTVMRQETEIDENEGGHAQEMGGEIVFDQVTFGYDDTPILKDISFRAAPGETIAIVGQTGSGKSTLTRLVNRTYDVDGGRILIDGCDVREWDLDALRSQISTIEQDVFLFSKSVAENIAFGLGAGANGGAPDRSAVERAAREAQADAFIRRFKDGYETEVGERGVMLSGGQRQRLAIARALLTDPRILILDDATSAIDSATEDQIQTAIARVLEGRTTLLITHRLSQIRRADRILVLQRGRLIDQGTHDELVARCALYRRIFLREAAPTPGADGAIA